MMRFHLPTTAAEAVAILASDADARCLAGGQTLVAMMNADLVMPSALVSLRRIGALAQIATAPEVRIGAMVTHARIASTRLGSAASVLSAAAGVIAHPPIRRMGTIGGAVALADPAADYPPALVAADARIHVLGARGERAVAAADFFLGYFETALEAGEIVTAVSVPQAPGATRGVYDKLARTHGDYGVLSVAAVVAMDAGRCVHVRVALGGMGPVPVQVDEADAVLVGSRFEDAAIAAAAAHLAEAADPVDDFRASAQYRLRVLPHILGRTLRRALVGEVAA